MKKIFFIQLFFFFFVKAVAQAPAQLAPVNADSVEEVTSIKTHTALFIDNTGKMDLSGVMRSSFIPLQQWDQLTKIEPSDIPKTFYLQFTIFNPSSHTKMFYHYPGKLFDKITLYHVNHSACSVLKTNRFHDGFIPISIGPGQSEQYLIKLNFFKTGFNRLESRLVSKLHIEDYKKDLYGSINNKKTVGIILSGMLLMMILVTLLNYSISKRVEFLYNSLYSVCMFLIIFFTTYLSMNPSWIKGFFISYVDLLLLILGANCYLAFTRHFLEAKIMYPKLDKFLKIGAWVTSILMAVYTVIFFFTSGYGYEIYLENIMKFFLLAVAFVYIFLAFIQKNKLANYLAVGAGIQLIFSGVSLGFLLTQSAALYIYTSPIFYFELGVVCSMIFFLLGLFYKNRLELITKIKEQEAMKLEVEKQRFENKLTVYKTQQEERNRISADMHDDLGAEMTTIRLYSELAKARFKDMAVSELDKISSSADELINNMNAIIWSMSSQNDSLGNMIAYIRSYSIEYLENTGIKPFVTIPDNLPDLEVNGTIRRNVFLVIKEALQNVVKHSGASEVIIKMNKEPEGLSLLIHDNGKGINFEKLRPFSNGLKNMQKRMQDINVDFRIENSSGTLIRLYAKTR